MEHETEPAPLLEKENRRRNRRAKLIRTKRTVFRLLWITSILSMGLAFASGINWGLFGLWGRLFTFSLVPFFFLAALLTIRLPLLPGNRFRFWIFQAAYVLLLLILPLAVNASWIMIQLEGQAYKINRIDRPALVKEAREFVESHLPHEYPDPDWEKMPPTIEDLHPFTMWLESGYVVIELMGGLGTGEGIHIHFEPGWQEKEKENTRSVSLGGGICYWEFYGTPEYDHTSFRISFMKKRCLQEP